MRALLQRVSEASVEVDGERIAEIGAGLLALVAAGVGDSDQDARRLAEKIARLRIFGDEQGRMNRSVIDVAGSVLWPGFTGAAPPEEGRVLVDAVADQLRLAGLEVQSGRFGAHMRVSLVNDGPVTIWLESV